MARSYARLRQTSYDRTLLARAKPRARQRGKNTKWVGARLRYVGAFERKPQLIVIKEKDALRKHGYSVSKSDVARRSALAKAVKEFGALSVYRKLNAQYVFRKNYAPETAARFKADAEWVKNKFQG